MCSAVCVALFVAGCVARYPNGRQQKFPYRTSSELKHSVLEINRVTNVTTVLIETTASYRVSRLCCSVCCKVSYSGFSVAGGSHICSGWQPCYCIYSNKSKTKKKFKTPSSSPLSREV